MAPASESHIKETVREGGRWHSSDPPDSLPSSAKAEKSDETGLQHQATEWEAMWRTHRRSEGHSVDGRSLPFRSPFRAI